MVRLCHLNDTLWYNKISLSDPVSFFLFGICNIGSNSPPRLPYDPKVVILQRKATIFVGMNSLKYGKHFMSYDKASRDTVFNMHFTFFLIIYS